MTMPSNPRSTESALASEVDSTAALICSTSALEEIRLAQESKELFWVNVLDGLTRSLQRVHRLKTSNESEDVMSDFNHVGHVRSNGRGSSLRNTVDSQKDFVLVNADCLEQVELSRNEMQGRRDIDHDDIDLVRDEISGIRSYCS